MAFGTPDANKFVRYAFRVVPLPSGDFAVGSEIFLFNFAINNAAMQPQHVKWLDDWFASEEIDFLFNHPTRKDAWRVEIIGQASKSGAASHNLQLSQSRAQSVHNYMLDPLVFPSGNQRPGKIKDAEIMSFGKGNQLAKGTGEAGEDRQVVMRIQLQSEPPFPLLGSIGSKSQDVRIVDHGIKHMYTSCQARRNSPWA